MSNQPEACSNCKFWLEESGETICRRFPPQVIPLPRGPKEPVKSNPTVKLISQFPPMQPHGWCGEHKRVLQ